MTYIKTKPPSYLDLEPPPQQTHTGRAAQHEKVKDGALIPGDSGAVCQHSITRLILTDASVRHGGQEPELWTSKGGNQSSYHFLCERSWASHGHLSGL